MESENNPEDAKASASGPSTHRPNENEANAGGPNREKIIPNENALDLVLYHVGEMGLYQKLLFLAMLPFGFFLAFAYFVQIFITETPIRHWCHVPELHNLSADRRINMIAPPIYDDDDVSFDRCRMYNIDWSGVSKDTVTPPPPNTPIIFCKRGWEYDFTDIPYPTASTEREWVCQKSSYIPLAQAIFFGGAIVGGLLLGWIADRFGRVPAVVGANILGAVGGIATIYTKGFIDFAVCRFIVGMGFDNLFMMMYILVLEYVGPHWRSRVANIAMALFFGGGCVILPWLALWISNWRTLLWVTSLPMFMVLIVPWTVPESMRWLMDKGHVNEALVVLRKFEKINRTEVPNDVIERFIDSANQKKVHPNLTLIQAFQESSLLRSTMIMMIIVYCMCTIIFDGLLRMSHEFGLNFFVTFTLHAATEIPSVLVLAFLLDRWGRRNLCIFPLAISGMLALFAAAVHKGIIQASLAIMSRFFINMSFNTAIQWATELLPTPVRASGSAAMHTSGYVATALSPFIVYSERLWHRLPLLIMGVIALVAASLGQSLPETTGRHMPQTIADGERIIIEGRAEILDGRWKNIFNKLKTRVGTTAQLFKKQ